MTKPATEINNFKSLLPALSSDWAAQELAELGCEAITAYYLAGQRFVDMRTFGELSKHNVQTLEKRPL